jgi:sulfur-carrier protein
MPASCSSSTKPALIRVQIYGLLRLVLGGREVLELPWQEGDTVGRVLEKFQGALTIPVTHQLLDAGGALQLGTIILVNRRNILHLEGLETPLRDGDLLALFPPGAGG